MADPDTSGVDADASADPGAAEAKAVALVTRLARAHPHELASLLEGPLQGAVRAAADYASDSTAEATQAAYRRDWAEFSAWCRANKAGDPAGADPELPVNPVLVAAWLATLAGTVGLSALRRRVAAIAHHHRRRGFTFSGAHPAIRETMAGIARRHGKPKRPAAALTSTEIRQLLDTCTDDVTGTAGLASARDRALLLVGFAGAFRRSELVAIDVEHLRFDANGVTIRVPRSKRDQAGKGADVVLPRMPGRTAASSDTPVRHRTCPVRALEVWLKRGRIRFGSVFRSVSERGVLGERLSGAGVRHILLCRAKLAKLTVHPSERLSPHGLRAGFITEAYLAGAPDEQVAQHSRHGDLSSMRGYRRRAKITADNPARLLDL